MHMFKTSLNFVLCILQCVGGWIFAMTLNGWADGSRSSAVNTALKRKLCTTDKEHELATDSGSEKCSTVDSHIADKQEV